MYTHHVHFYLTLKYDPIMKKITTTLVVAWTLGVCASVSAQSGQAVSREQKATTLYNEGLVAMRGGNYDVATNNFRGVLRLYPKHHHAQRNLLHILNNRKSLETRKRKRALKSVIVPKVDLDNVTVQEALDVLTILVENASKKKVTPNFVVQDTGGAFEKSSITLRLNNVPAETVLNYIVDHSRAHVRYDGHAIVVSSRSVQKAQPAQKAAAPSLEIP